MSTYEVEGAQQTGVEEGGARAAQEERRGILLTAIF
jgi:hypothetical protein